MSYLRSYKIELKMTNVQSIWVIHSIFPMQTKGGHIMNIDT
jgi:hypothetical protein